MKPWYFLDHRKHLALFALLRRGLKMLLVLWDLYKKPFFLHSFSYSFSRNYNFATLPSQCLGNISFFLHVGKQGSYLDQKIGQGKQSLLLKVELILVCNGFNTFKYYLNVFSSIINVSYIAQLWGMQGSRLSFYTG